MQEAYEQLKSLNFEFCSNARDLRWQLPNGNFCNSNPNRFDYWDINVGWVRSIMPKANSPLLYFLDIDGRGLSSSMLDACYKLTIELKRITGFFPVCKATGNSGLHLYYQFWYPTNWSQRHIWETMRNLTYTAFLRAGLEDDGYLIGMLKKDNIPRNCPGFIDMRVYRDGVVRGYSLHPKTGKYAVPFYPWEDLSTIYSRMKLETEVPLAEIPAMQFNPQWKLETYKESESFSTAHVPRDISYLEEMVDPNFKGDKYYQALPPRFKAIVRMKDDIDHDLKFALVSHMVYYFKDITRKELTDWVWKRCRWIDLDNYETTSYQVRSIFDWVEERIPLENLNGFVENNTPPLRLNYYRDEKDLNIHDDI